MGRAVFTLKSAFMAASGQNKDCPYCGFKSTNLIERKYVLWHLRKCPNCLFMFRWPKDSVKSNNRFYQRAYREGHTTDMPDAIELQRFLMNVFSINTLNYKERIKILKSLGESRNVLDYGASWGYGVWQLQKAGFNAVGFEVSTPRAEYGRKNLGVKIETDTALLSVDSFDIIHTAHVLEHIPDLKTSFQDFRRLLKPGGTLVIFVPNAGGRSASQMGTGWGPMIGEKHVNALTADFFARNLSNHGFNSIMFDSSPYDMGLRGFDDHPSLSGDELLIVAKRIA
jgi:2-polyprenyl-3-methyl-5-hydroxy-6-metoxy-1,4-benzoquinol methylase